MSSLVNPSSLSTGILSSRGSQELKDMFESSGDSLEDNIPDEKLTGPKYE